MKTRCLFRCFLRALPVAWLVLSVSAEAVQFNTNPSLALAGLPAYAGEAKSFAFVPGELIVKFDHGVMTVSSNSETPINQVIINNAQVADFFTSHNVLSIERLCKWLAGKRNPTYTDKSGKTIPLNDLSDLYLLRMGPLGDMPALAGELEQIPGVIYARPNAIGSFDIYEPDDPDYELQWGLYNQSYRWDIDAFHAWDIADQEDANNGLLYILDSGLEPLHRDQPGDEFQNRVVDEWYSQSNPYGDVVDRNGHGTFMTGVAAASTNSGPGHGGVHGIAGVAGGWYYAGDPGPSLGICVVGVTAPIEAWCIEALDYFASQSNVAKVASCSWSATDNPALHEAIENSFLSDQSVFFSSGNASTPQPNSVEYPAYWADYDICSAVGAIDSVGIRADFSCYGPQLSFVAPGDSIWSTTNEANGFYTYGSGTSPSTAYAAGVAALIYQKTMVKGWDLIDVDVKRIMELSARHNDCIYGSGPDVETGYGCIDAWWALRHLDTPYVFTRLDGSAGVGYYQGEHVVTFTEPPNDYWPAGTYNCERYKEEAHYNTITLNAYENDLWIWGRIKNPPSDTVGYKIDSVNNAHPYVYVDTTSASYPIAYTYSYKLLENLDSHTTVSTHNWAPALNTHMAAPITFIGKLRPTLLKTAAVDEDNIIYLVNQNPDGIPTLRYQLSKTTYVSIAVYNVTGEKVTTLVSGQKPAGKYNLDWHNCDDKGRNVAAGCYFIRMDTPDASSTLKMVKYR